MLSTNHVHIDLDAIDHNIAVLREALAAPDGHPARICAVIKADAYGLGAVRVAHRLEKAGVAMLAVYTLDEAVELLGASVRTPVLVMSPVRSIADSDTLYRAVSHGRLHFSLQALEQAAALGKQADRFGVEIPVHVDVNTGMNRGGALPAEAEEILTYAASHRRLIVAGISTHFASAQSDARATELQADRFDAWLASMGDRVPTKAVIHEANTCALFRSARTHRGMARVGFALAGYASEEMADPENFELIALARSLRPAVRWTSRVAHLQWIDAGEPVGYGGTWTAPRRTRLALVPAGYADGYPLSLSGKGIVRLPVGDDAFAVAPVVGRVSMDQITIDVTDIPTDTISIDHEVELVSADPAAPNHLPEVAHAAGTSTHELMCRLSHRVPRRYLSDTTPRGVVVTRPAVPAPHA